MKMKRLLALLCGSMVLVATGAKADGWPSSVVGNWTGTGDRSSFRLNVTFQSASGQCRQILGTMNADTIEGFYCPFSGRIHFVRKLATFNDTIQVWTGGLSQVGVPLRMAGTFSSVNSIGGSLGEYNFNATSREALQ